MHPEKGPGEDLSVLCVVCPLVLRCQGKACLSTCCLSSGILNEAPGEGLSVGFVVLYGASQCKSKNSHPSYTYRNPPSIYFCFILVHPLSTFFVCPYSSPPIFTYFIILFSCSCYIPHPLFHYYVLILYCASQASLGWLCTYTSDT